MSTEPPRSLPAPWRWQLSLANPILLAAVGGSFALAVAGVYLPVLQSLLGTEPLAAADLAVCGAVAAVGWLAARATSQGVGRWAHGPRSVASTSGVAAV
ncbi:MAG: cation transporting ATPase C-terminal domain-containing protein [Propionibacteriales bacterium]|nr:cation transporting ATPase C-terminal domain-containing protein [Propionibacteriales bacterium]